MKRLVIEALSFSRRGAIIERLVATVVSFSGSACSIDAVKCVSDRECDSALRCVNYSCVVANNPTPELDSISPATATAGDAELTLTLSGANFMNASQVTFGSVTATPTFMSSSQLSVRVSASWIAGDGTRVVTVTNPAPGGGTSEGRPFRIEPRWALLDQGGEPPSLRSSSSVVLDPETGSMILFGGRRESSSVPLPGVFVLTNVNGLSTPSSWRRLDTGTLEPPSRSVHRAVYDRKKHSMIVGTGCTAPMGCRCIAPCNSPGGGWWLLENVNGVLGSPRWKQLSASGGPSGRIDYVMAYDEPSNRLIVWGGHDGWGMISGHVSSETWILKNANGADPNPSTWARLSPIGGPPPGPYHASYAYDQIHYRLIVAGGSGKDPSPGDPGMYNEVWVLEGADGQDEVHPPRWNRLDPEGDLPKPFAGRPASYDPMSNRLTVLLEEDGVVEPWVLTNANGLEQTRPKWIHVRAPFPGPSFGAQAGSLTYDPSKNIMTVVLNADPMSYPRLSIPIWTLRHANGLAQ